MTKRVVSPTVSVRVSQELYKQFRTKSTKYGGVSEVLRELMLALVEERLTIQPPKLKSDSLFTITSTN